MKNNADLIVRLGAAIKTLGDNEDNRINFEFYLEGCAEKWFSHFCKDFESLVEELEHFAYMEM